MNLVVDIGNSFCKAAVFAEGEITVSSHWGIKDPSPIHDWLKTYPDINSAVISSVRKDDAGIGTLLEKAGIPVLVLDEHTPLPLANRYRSSSTLGKDRLAAAAGANAMFPGQNLLVIDAGTAVTIDFVSAANEFLGGNISPGLSMRFRSLHEFTDNLPLVGPSVAGELMGEDTEAAIGKGVLYGIIFELDGYINRLKIRYPDLKVIATGGDAKFFDKKLKNSIFVDPDLNLRGLFRILDYNAGI